MSFFQKIIAKPVTILKTALILQMTIYEMRSSIMLTKLITVRANRALWLWFVRFANRNLLRILMRRRSYLIRLYEKAQLKSRRTHQMRKGDPHFDLSCLECAALNVLTSAHKAHVNTQQLIPKRHTILTSYVVCRVWPVPVLMCVTNPGNRAYCRWVVMVADTLVANPPGPASDRCASGTRKAQDTSRVSYWLWLTVYWWAVHAINGRHSKMPLNRGTFLDKYVHLTDAESVEHLSDKAHVCCST